MAEVDLYEPIKRFLTSQGYDVKGEVDACDIVAVGRSNGVTSGRPFAHRRRGTSRFPGERVRQAERTSAVADATKAIAT